MAIWHRREPGINQSYNLRPGDPGWMVGVPPEAQWHLEGPPDQPTAAAAPAAAAGTPPGYGAAPAPSWRSTPEWGQFSRLLYNRTMAQVSGDLGRRGLMSSSMYGAASARAGVEAQLSGWQMREQAASAEHQRQYDLAQLAFQREQLQRQTELGYAGIAQQRYGVDVQRGLGYAGLSQQREEMRGRWGMFQDQLNQSTYWSNIQTRLGLYGRQGMGGNPYGGNYGQGDGGQGWNDAEVARPGAYSGNYGAAEDWNFSHPQNYGGYW